MPAPTVTLDGMSTQLEIELAALRARRQSPGFKAWIRHFRPFDRRAIREPDSRDTYWLNVQQCLGVSDAASLTRYSSTEPPSRPER